MDILYLYPFYICMKILVIDDHPKLRENIKKMCELAFFTVETAIHGIEALEKLRGSQYDCIILDMNMPLMDGHEFLKKLRTYDRETPVLVLTSNSLTEDKVEAFDIGADDYLTKPFDVDELIARLRALGRRGGIQSENRIHIGNICIDITHSKVLQDGAWVELSAKEYKIIAYLSEYIGTPKTKESILEAVWWEREWSLEWDSTTLEAHISTIRKKLWKDFITTLRWLWYVIDKK